MKNSNLKNIFKLFRKNMQLTALDIANILNISIPTVNKNLIILEAQGYISVTKFKRITGGRGAKIFEFNNQKKFSIGIELEIDAIKIMLIDLSLNILIEKEININLFEKFSIKLKREINCFLSQNKLTENNIVGIGLSLSEIIIVENSILKIFEKNNYKNFNIPIYIENKVNCSAYAEQEIRGVEINETLFLISITESLSGSYIYKNKVRKGNNNITSKIGHITINFNGDICSCGNIGCWEQYASVKNLVNKYEKDKVYIDNYIQMIVIGLKNIILLYDPSYLIISGYIEKYNEIVLPLLKKYLFKDKYFLSNNLILDFSTLKEKSSIFGAALLPINNLF